MKIAHNDFYAGSSPARRTEKKSFQKVESWSQHVSEDNIRVAIIKTNYLLYASTIAAWLVFIVITWIVFIRNEK